MSIKIHFLNVGSGDCTIIEGDDFAVMVDCGSRASGKDSLDGPGIWEYFSKNISGNKLDLLIVTHPHGDHYQGLLYKPSQIVVKEFWESPFNWTNRSIKMRELDWRNYRRVIDRIECEKKVVATAGLVRNFGNLSLDLIWPSSECVENTLALDCHNACLALRISWMNKSLLVLGDISDYAISKLMNVGAFKGCSILRTSHHGKLSGLGDQFGFMKSLKPQYTVVSSTMAEINGSASINSISKYWAFTSRRNLYFTDRASSEKFWSKMGKFPEENSNLRYVDGALLFLA